jgi:DNA (cytosine-5)-methyltransferase 1
MSRNKQKKAKPIAVDLFCGCGAVTQGLKSRFEIVAAVDNDPLAAATYRANHKNVHLYKADITQLDPNLIRNATGNRDIDLLVVCAPCQPFSSQNQSKAFDERSVLILQAIRYAKVLRPKLIFFENVKGLLSPRNRPIIEKLKADLVSQGYEFWVGPKEVDAADYRVPQRRKRCVMMCSRQKEVFPSIPKVSTPQGKRVTVIDAIGDMEPLSSGESSLDEMHFARNHSVIALKRIKHVPKNGGSRFSLPEELVLDCHKNHKGHPDVYGRMAWTDVAPTLTTGCTDVTRGRYIHPRDDRAVTLREVARLQTFSDRYKFHGSPQAIARQIGNAVPVEMVRAFAKEMANALDDV